MQAALAGKDIVDVRSDWQKWVRIRDACSIGREWRYSDDQIRYHYVADRALLRSLASTPAPASESSSKPQTDSAGTGAAAVDS